MCDEGDIEDAVSVLVSVAEIPTQDPASVETIGYRGPNGATIRA